MGYEITYKESGYSDFPVSVFVNGEYLDDFQDKPDNQVVISLYRDMKLEGII